MISENLQKHYQKLIQNEIRQFERFREQATKRSTSANLAHFDEKIAILKKELQGEETPRFLQFVQEQQDAAALQAKNACKKKLIQENREHKEKLDVFYKEESAIRRMDRNLKYHSRREWDWMCRQHALLPDYIRKNLETMPNNRGYIWKGIWYFGKRPTPPHDVHMTIMVERIYNNLRIHEICKDQYHRIYSSKNGVKELISDTSLSKL